jgi:transcription-repair coupling factor (superfamily II helicase)
LLNIDNILNNKAEMLIGGVPEGYDGVVLGQLIDAGNSVLFVARDDRRMAALQASLRFFASDAEVIEFPAWDCLPYDRVSPKNDIIAARIDALTNLVDAKADQPRIILSTIAALLQRVPARKSLQGSSLKFGTGGETLRDRLLSYLEQNGYGRSETVMEPGEYAIRGGIIDLFPPGFEEPLRLDFFGDDLDGIRSFEPFSQRTSGECDSFTLKPVNEVSLDEDAISRFRTAYRALFGAVSSEDPLYEAISEGHTQAGMEHWLPLFHEELETLLDYVPNAVIVLDHQAEEAAESRWELIGECYDARSDMKARGLAVSETTYNPLPVDRLYLTAKDLENAFAGRKKLKIQSFSAPDSQANSSDAGGKPGHDFADARALPDVNVYDALRAHIETENQADRAVVIGAFSEGSAERLLGILKEHDIPASTNPESRIRLAVLELEHGFTAPGLALITEQDILGDRLSSPQRRKIRPENFIAETSVLSAGDLVVHSDHGIGRFEELVTLDVTDSGAPHDCLKLIYHGGDKLFLPVENIEIISRYGEGSDTMRLDKLGGVAWQARKSQLKQRIRDMADQLIAVAAARELKKGETLEPQPGIYDEFCSGFAFTETDDQARAIGDVIKDMASGRPMDRLICGDVGFGKTEVALRATFVAAMEGKQVAIVVPTTLLSRQHFRIFEERFADFPVRVRQLSRLVSKKDAEETKEGLKTGQVDIVIGTHALLAESMTFDRLGLLIIDEEQHFGVVHKEQLKSMKHNVHVLTLTATPIPRTLQMALTGVRELSLITTPPVDRLAVRTFVLPYDPVVVREAIQRERYRGGQIFYVCPRVADLGHIEGELKELVPDLRIARAHGQMPPAKLEDVMNAFYDGKYDLLLATNIVESGLDLPSVNTIILHRSDMFGLAQLYQLRGRIGRSKVRGYAYLTIPPKRKLAATAMKRLEVMQSLDTLGAGFTLASHDLDIRGAGNLLGDEQSGHIKEVGVELYQQMLEEAVAEAKSAGDVEDQVADKWSPQIDIGIPVLIPAEFVPDLGVRLTLYRRIADLTDRAEIDAFAAEMIDRFGSLPDEVENLLKTVAIKRLCLAAGVEKVDAGSKGAVVSFRNNEFNNPAGLVTFITSQVGTTKLRPDHKLVFMRSWDAAAARLDGVQYLMKELSTIAA